MTVKLAQLAIFSVVLCLGVTGCILPQQKKPSQPTSSASAVVASSPTNVNPLTDNKANLDSVAYATKFTQYLDETRIEPTVIYNNDQTPFMATGDGNQQNFTTKFRLLDFLITAKTSDKGLTLIVNQHTIPVYNLTTVNKVWADRDKVDYANALRQVKYYKDAQIMIFDVFLDNCNGVGCGVSYQIVYDIKHKKEFAFGKFRSGLEPNLYNSTQDGHELIYYVSSSFTGRDETEIDTITYQIFPINQPKPQILPAYFAKFTYPSEQYDTLTDFEVKWLGFN